MYHLLLLLTLPLMVWSEQQTAVLIIGGYDSGTPLPEGPILDSVELYGCEGGPIRVADLPSGLYLSGGIVLPDPGDDHHVMVCGGYTCTGTNCGQTSTCLTWNPVSNVWLSDDVAPMLRNRFNFIMAHAPSTNRKGETPIVLGFLTGTEIFGQHDNTWVEHPPVPSTASWTATGCLFQEQEGKRDVYNVGWNVEKLDVEDWSVTNLGEVPEVLASPGRCSPVTIDGRQGIFTRHGYFLDLSTMQWEKKAIPPFDTLASYPNSMFSFRGRPTIFGTAKCDDVGQCEYVGVIQYVPEDDEWISLEDMSTPRGYHLVVEVPGEYCDYFAY